MSVGPVTEGPAVTLLAPVALDSFDDLDFTFTTLRGQNLAGQVLLVLGRSVWLSAANTLIV